MEEQNVMASALPIPPSPSIPKSILEKFTGCQVLTHRIESGSKPGDNYMSVIYSVTAEIISHDKSEKEIRHYLFKCFPQHPARQGYLSKTNMFYKELQFYQVWVKELIEFQNPQQIFIPAFPPCFGGEAIDYSDPSTSKSKVYTSLDNFIILTDMKKTGGYEMVEKTRGLDLNHMLLVFKELAKIHALSWAFKKKHNLDLQKKFPFFKNPFFPDDMEMWGKIVGGNVNIAVETMDSVLGQGNKLSASTRQFEKKVLKIIELFLNQNDSTEKDLWEIHRDPPKDMVDATKKEEPWRVITHGDCWSMNFLFKYNQTTREPESVILFDFQLSREACPSVDWAYVLYTSSTTDFRKAHLDAVFQVYHDTFIEVCEALNTEPLPDFNMASVKRRFHCAKPIGYMMAVTALPGILREADKAINLEEVDEGKNMSDMFIEAFGKDTGGAGSLYENRILEIAEELYAEGVI